MRCPRGMRRVRLTAEEEELGLKFHFIRRGETVKKRKRCGECGARLSFGRGSCPRGCNQHQRGGF